MANIENIDILVFSENRLRSIIREMVAEMSDPNTASVQQRFYLEDAAAYVGLPIPSFRLHQHKIGGTKIGKRWMFTKAELDKFLEANRRKTMEEIREAI